VDDGALFAKVFYDEDDEDDDYNYNYDTEVQSPAPSRRVIARPAVLKRASAKGH
jgi:hypothetical protein